LGVMDNIQDLRHHVHGFEVGFEARSDTTIQRAAGFYQLYEAAMRLEWSADKESGSTITEGKGKGKESKKKIAKKVESDAAAEVRQLSELPALKWTWGVDLTTDDVLQLFQTSTLGRIPRQPHSEYEVSLPWGRYGEVSDAPTSPWTSSLDFSDIDKDHQEVTELDSLDIPTHFTLSPLCHSYDDPPPFESNVSGSPLDDSSTPADASWLQPQNDNFVQTPPMDGKSSSNTQR
jgi:hypothetical protein